MSVSHQFQGTAPAYSRVVSAGVAGVEVHDLPVGVLHTTEISLSDVVATLPIGNKYIGVKLLEMPLGRILLMGATQKVSLAAAGGIGATDALGYALGTVAASSTTLAGTMVDVAPADTAALVAGEKVVQNALASSAQIDGTGTAMAVFLNLADASQAGSDGVVTLNGTIRLTWAYLGAYAV